MISQSQQSGLQDLIEGTKAFIDDDPTTITVVPARSADKVRKPGGGFDYPQATPRAPQVVKIISTGGDFTGISTNDSTYSETVRKFTYVLLTMPDAVFEIGDTWQDGENRYRIDAKLVDNGYEKKYGVTTFGPEPNYG